MTFEKVAEVWRGSVVESVHFGAAAVANARGEIVHGWGDPSFTTYPRSALKPIQAIILVESGAYRAFGLARDGWWNVTAKPFLEDPRLAFDRIRNASLKGSLMPHSDVLQLGGVAIVDREGILRYLHRSRKTDDLPATSALLAELDRLEQT